MSGDGSTEFQLGCALDCQAAKAAFCNIFGSAGGGPHRVWINGPASGAPPTTQAVSVSAP